jgi:hypothetical protein
MGSRLQSNETAPAAKVDTLMLGTILSQLPGHELPKIRVQSHRNYPVAYPKQMRQRSGEAGDRPKSPAAKPIGLPNTQVLRIGNSSNGRLPRYEHRG